MPETTTTTEVTYRPFLDLLTEGHTLPAGFDTWGYKLVRPDLRTYPAANLDGERFRWPFPGHTVEDPNAVASEEVCPSPIIGGFAVTKTLRGARDGMHGPTTILLLAYNQADVLASNEHKIRVRRAHVVDVLNATEFYRKAAGYDLSGASLTGVNLNNAELSGANLSGAKMARVSLKGADLSGADLSEADLLGANLDGANLDGANVHGASFLRANLKRVTGTVKNAARATLTNAVKDDSGPFRVLNVPHGRTDIGEALETAGVSFTYSDATPAVPRRSRW